MLRIRKEHIGKRVGNGNTLYILTEDLTQKQLLYIKNMVADAFVEEFDEVKEKAEKEVIDYVDNSTKKKSKKDAKDSEEYDK